MKKGRRKTYQDDQKIGHSKIHDEQVGHRPHVSMLDHNIKYKRIAEKTSNKNDDMQAYEYPL